VTGGNADVVRRSGRGLAGLAERVRLLNGEFKAGPDGAHGWRLSVQLPVRVAR
jgi:signal transduction histidine kinase